MRGQHAGGGGGVDDLAGQHPVGGLPQPQPVHREIGLLVLGLGPADVPQSAGQIDPHRLVAEAGRGRDIDQYPPVLGDQSGLLAQFAGRRGGRILPGFVEQTRGQLPEPVAQGVPVLIDQRQLFLIIDRGDCHRAEVLYDLADDGDTAGHPDLVGAQREDLSAVDGFGRDGLEFMLSHGGDQPRA